MEELAKVISLFNDIEILAAEIAAAVDEKEKIETIDDLIEYLKLELEATQY